MGMGLVMSTSSQSWYSNSWKYSPPVVLIRGVDTPRVGVLTWHHLMSVSCLCV